MAPIQAQYGLRGAKFPVMRREAKSLCSGCTPPVQRDPANRLRPCARNQHPLESLSELGRIAELSPRASLQSARQNFLRSRLGPIVQPNRRNSSTVMAWFWWAARKGTWSPSGIVDTPKPHFETCPNASRPSPPRRRCRSGASCILREGWT
jgi:hypothetical protein